MFLVPLGNVFRSLHDSLPTSCSLLTLCESTYALYSLAVEPTGKVFVEDITCSSVMPIVNVIKCHENISNCWLVIVFEE